MYVYVKINTHISIHYLLYFIFQVIAGLEWKLKVRMVHTHCLKEEKIKSIQNCEQDTKKEVLICTVTIYEKLWENHISLKDHNCSPENRKGTSSS